jgi:hypothetical protein
MELIISKKIKELDDMLDHFIDEVKLISSLDKECKIENSIHEKLSHIKLWIETSRPKIKKTDSEEPEPLPIPDLLVKKESVPSFMRPTFSFLAGTSFTPHIHHESRSASSERTRQNEVSKLQNLERTRRSESVERPKRSESVERPKRSESVDRIRRSESVEPKKDESTENKDKSTENKDKSTENKDKSTENKDKSTENKDKSTENNKKESI